MKICAFIMFVLVLSATFNVRAIEADKIIGLDNINNFTHEMKCTKLSEIEALQIYHLHQLDPLYLESALGFTVASHDLVLRHNDTEVARFRFANVFVSNWYYVNRRNESENTPTFDRCNREKERTDNDTTDSERVARIIKELIYTENIVYKKTNENSCYKKVISLRERGECSVTNNNDEVMVSPENGKCPVWPQVTRAVVPCSGNIILEDVSPKSTEGVKLLPLFLTK